MPNRGIAWLNPGAAVWLRTGRAVAAVALLWLAHQAAGMPLLRVGPLSIPGLAVTVDFVLLAAFAAVVRVMVMGSPRRAAGLWRAAA